MWLWIILTIVILAMLFLFVQAKRRQKIPHETYVCTTCGERDCICHKEE